MSTEARARWSDPDTSHDAAASILDVRVNQQYVWSILESLGNATDEELVAAYEQAAADHLVVMQSPSGIRTRRAELVTLKLVEWSGTKRRIHTGRLARVWQLVQP